MALVSREDKGELFHLHFSVSILAITTGKYEITSRCRGDEFRENEYIWIGTEYSNIIIVVIPSPFQGIIRTMTSGVVRQFMKWFEENVKVEGYPTNDDDNTTNTANTNTNCTCTTANGILLNGLSTSLIPFGNASHNNNNNNKDKGNRNLIAYCSSLIASTAFESNIEVDYCDGLVKLLHGSTWLNSVSNIKRLLVWSLGSTYLANSFQKRYIFIIYYFNSITDFQRDLATPNPRYIQPTESPNEKQAKYKSLCGALSALLKIAIQTRNVTSDDSFRSILNNQRYSPLPFSRRALTPMRIAKSGGNTSSVLFELLLDICKNCIPDISDKKFCDQLVNTVAGSDDSLVQLYLIRVMRALYDKPPVILPTEIHSNSKNVTQAICNAFLMHCEWYEYISCYLNRNKEKTKNEFENEYEINYDTKHPGPLSTLLKLVNNIIERPPKCLQNVVYHKSNNKDDNSENDTDNEDDNDNDESNKTKFLKKSKKLPSPSSPIRDFSIPSLSLPPPRRNSIAFETLHELHQPVIVESDNKKNIIPAKHKYNLIPQYGSFKMSSPVMAKSTLDNIQCKCEGEKPLKPNYDDIDDINSKITNTATTTNQEQQSFDDTSIPVLPLRLDFLSFRGKSSSLNSKEKVDNAIVNCEELHNQPQVTEEMAKAADQHHKENLLLISKTLLILIYKLETDHPDYKKIIELIVTMCQKNKDVFIMTIKKLLNTTAKQISQQCFLFRLLCNLLNQEETTKNLELHKLEV